MLKKTMVLAVAIAALAALVPSMANASNRNWLHNGSPLGAKATVVTHGEVGFTGDNGGVHCQTTATAHLEPGSTGTVTSFDPRSSDTGACKYHGALDFLCNPPLTVHESTKLPWTIHATKFGDGTYGIVVTNLEVHVDGTNPLCPNVTVTGNAYLKGDPHEGKNLSVTNDNSSAAGTLHSPTTESHALGTGSVEITPAGTYKIET